MSTGTSPDVLTKRLHVSGLTPHISTTDLEARFSSFGTVKALDGLGKLDALGQPRRYAYVTLETTKPQLAKCLNLLSGTTWKGAKLRIGEAKPDFRERILKENDADGERRPSKRRRRLARGTEGVYAPDMSPVTTPSQSQSTLHPTTTSSLRPGWRITPLGRLVRPIRIRPLRPLVLAAHAQKQGKEKKMKTKTKTKGLLVRQRRRKIDPEEWGSTYLSGIMLEGGSGLVLAEKAVEETTTKDAVPEVLTAESLKLPDDIPATRSPSPVGRDLSSVDSTNTESRPLDIAGEAKQSLALLNSLFQEDDWGGAESLSDIEKMDVEPPPLTSSAVTTLDDVDDNIEYVPHRTSGSPKPQEDESMETKDVTVPQQQTKTQTTKLKDMFAPRPEDAGFSILDNLDLDLDLNPDETLAIAPAPPQTPQPQLSPSTPIPAASRQPTSTFDPNRPFFFPHSLNPDSPLTIKPDDPRDIFCVQPDFFRTESAEEIRARWEARKVELTRDWKRRHREAVKSARRRGGAQAVGVE